MIIARTTKKSSKTQLAKSLAISRQSLYYQPKREAIDYLLKYQIDAVMATNPAYGHRRIATRLNLNKKQVLRVMKKFNLKPFKRRAKYPFKPEDQNKIITAFSNQVKTFCPIKPNIVWATDFTYINFQGRFIYLATVIDIYTREILGWHISRSHNQSLVIGALRHALGKTKTRPLYHHSDQGSEYDSNENIRILKSQGIIISMSAKSSPWENPFQESFYSQFKLELADTSRFDTLGELIVAIYQQIYYYNHNRIHTALRTSPVKFREQYMKNSSNNLYRQSV